jgi:hypothetical protein
MLAGNSNRSAVSVFLRVVLMLLRLSHLDHHLENEIENASSWA